ncbi:phage tail tube protein [Roseococcus sp. YIM B11640]|uniref:phage tail tube protein n=1 Tax=Roseococcus sp. YIM B11640 TaxID=3133973 RepID=UPI003C7BF4B9
MGLYQSGRNVVVAYKANAGVYGTPATSGAGASGLRFNTGGLNLTKQLIESGENRRDGMSTRGRHGLRSVAGSYAAELQVGAFDALFEAALRSTWVASATVTQATMSSATLSVAADGYVASTGSWITAGLRVGDEIQFTAGVTVANRVRTRIVGLTATKITVAEPLTVEAGPIATWSVTRAKKLIQASSPVDRDFSWEEYAVDIDQSIRYDGVRVTGFQLSMQPNGMVMVTFNLMGQDGVPLSTAASPYFTSPTFPTNGPLCSVEAAINFGGENLIDATAWELNFDLGAQPAQVIASTRTPDIFPGLAKVTGSITALRRNLNRLSDFLAETQVGFYCRLAENEASPADFMGVAITNMTIGGAQGSQWGADGPQTVQMPFVVGIDEAGGAFDPTMLKLTSSAP